MIDAERAVERLTQEHTEHTEAGPVEWPPLLEWLEKSVTEQVKRGQAGSGGTGNLIDLEALALLQRIELGVRQMREALYLPTIRDTAKGLIEAWKTAEKYHSKGELEDAQWERICEAIPAWVTAIEQEWNDRTRIMEITVPCPRCGTRWVLEDQDGEEKRRSAVRIEYAPNRAPVAKCNAAECEAIWVGWSDMMRLGLTVDASLDLEVLAACGINLDGVSLA